MQRRKFIVVLALFTIIGSWGEIAGAADLTLLSGNAAETQILVQAVRILLEENLGLKIEHIRNFSAHVLQHNAMLAGEGDAYVSYTGTQFTGILEREVTEEWKDRKKIFDYVKEQWQERFGATWLEPFGFNNTYCIAVRRDFAEEHKLKVMSDLQGISPTMTLAMDTVFRDRPGDGLEEMNRAYGLSWRRPVIMEYGLIYRATRSADVDAAVAYSTDGRISALNLVPLGDDLNIFPPYDCALVIKNEVLEQFPAIPEVLAPLIGNIDDETMSYYNQLADVHHQEVADVARQMVDDLSK